MSREVERSRPSVLAECRRHETQRTPRARVGGRRLIQARALDFVEFESIGIDGPCERQKVISDAAAGADVEARHRKIAKHSA